MILARGPCCSFPVSVLLLAAYSILVRGICQYLQCLCSSAQALYVNPPSATAWDHRGSGGASATRERCSCGEDPGSWACCVAC